MIIQSRLQSASYLSKSLLPRHVTSPECPRRVWRKHRATASRLIRKKAWIWLFPPWLGRGPQCIQLVLPRLSSSEWGQAPALPSTKTLSIGSNAFGTSVEQDNPTQEEHGKYLSAYILLLSQRPLMLVTCQPLMPASLSEILEMGVIGLTNLFSFHWIPTYDFAIWIEFCILEKCFLLNSKYDTENNQVFSIISITELGMLRFMKFTSVV